MMQTAASPRGFWPISREMLCIAVWGPLPSVPGRRDSLSPVQLNQFPLQARSAAGNRTPHESLWRVCAMEKDGETLPQSRSSYHNVHSSPSVVDGDMGAVIPRDEGGAFTKFIDDLLLQILNNPENPVRQTVLLSDGTDTRPYYLLWPSPSLIFDISPGSVHSMTSSKQLDNGLRVPRSCLLQHISVDFVKDEWGDEDFGEMLVRKGYRGDKPSVWVIQMPTNLCMETLQGMLTVAGSLMMKGCTLVGVIPISSVSTSEEETRISLTKLFVGHGFKLELYTNEEVALKWDLEDDSLSPYAFQNPSFAFIAKQQRLSDAQVEMARTQMEQAEEVDEDGFEDSW